MKGCPQYIILIISLLKLCATNRQKYKQIFTENEIGCSIRFDFNDIWLQDTLEPMAFDISGVKCHQRDVFICDICSPF